MKFSTAKTLSAAMLLAGLAAAVVALLAFEEGSSAYQVIELITLACLGLGLLIAIIWGRCPHCGRRLFFRMLKWEYCPSCQKALVQNPKVRRR